MLGKYKDLTKQDISELKESYGIPEGDKPLYIEDLNFIIKYRSEVFDVLDCFWQAENSKQKRDYEIAVEKAMQFAKSLEEYIKQAQPGNIMRRILFIENIQQDFRGAQIALPWLVRKYPSSLHKTTDPIAEDLGLFYSYVCSQALLDNHFLEETETESAKIIAERLMETVESDFLKRVDRRNLCYSDIFYLMGHYKKEIEALTNKSKALTQEKCMDCKMDDCFVTHCETMSDKIDIDAKIKKFRQVCDACVQKAFGREVSQQTISKIAKNIQDGLLRQVVCDILNMDTKNVSLKKRIIIDWGKTRNVCIQPSKVEEILAGSIESLNGVTDWSTKDIAAGIVLNDYDISKGTGDKVHDRFIEEYNELLEIINEKNKYLDLRTINIKVLMDEYKKIKLKNNNEELGGE